MNNSLNERYFKWVCHIAMDEDNAERYSEVLWYLYTKPFRYLIPNDSNRESDGLYLRYRFACQEDIPYPAVLMEVEMRNCSVLEVMVALCQRVEEDVMYDYEKGERTREWFADMLHSLKIDFVNGDPNFDYDLLNKRVENFLERRYAYTGEGGLFTIPDPPGDMRTAEIWIQAMWWLNYLMMY